MGFELETLTIQIWRYTNQAIGKLFIELIKLVYLGAISTYFFTSKAILTHFSLEMEKNRILIRSLINSHYGLELWESCLELDCKTQDLGFKSRHMLIFLYFCMVDMGFELETLTIQIWRYTNQAIGKLFIELIKLVDLGAISTYFFTSKAILTHFPLEMEKNRILIRSLIKSYHSLELWESCLELDCKTQDLGFKSRHLPIFHTIMSFYRFGNTQWYGYLMWFEFLINLISDFLTTRFIFY